jgi:DNA topoisomerase-2
LSNKARYIQENLEGTIDLRKKKKEQVTEMLKEKGFSIIDDEDYKYLVKMPMDSVTEENVERLLNDKANKEKDLEIVKNTSISQMWNSELDNLREQYIEYKDERTRIMTGDDVTNKTNKKKVISKGLVKKTNKKELFVLEDD